MKYIEYKNFIGAYTFYEDTGEYYGNILGIGCIIDFCGKTLPEMKEDFKCIIDDHIKETGDKGSFSNIQL